MGQLIRIIIILLGLWLVLRLLRRALAPRRHDRPPQTPISKMAACARCGVHVPESEAVYDRGKAYCCDSHRAAGG